LFQLFSLVSYLFKFENKQGHFRFKPVVTKQIIAKVIISTLQGSFRFQDNIGVTFGNSFVHKYNSAVFQLVVPFTKNSSPYE